MWKNLEGKWFSLQSFLRVKIVEKLSLGVWGILCLPNEEKLFYYLWVIWNVMQTLFNFSEKLIQLIFFERGQEANF